MATRGTLRRPRRLNVPPQRDKVWPRGTGAGMRRRKEFAFEILFRESPAGGARGPSHLDSP